MSFGEGTATLAAAGTALRASGAGNVGAMLGIGLVGLTITGLSIAGIATLARKIGTGRMSPGQQFFAVLGILALVGFALTGLVATGCGIMLSG